MKKSIAYSGYSYGEVYDILKFHFDNKHKKMKTDVVSWYCRVLMNLEQHEPDEAFPLCSLMVLVDKVKLRASFLY